MRPITHVNNFALKDDEHHALCTAHPGGFSAIYISTSKLFYKADLIRP
jgi:hypothetical protein